MKTYATIRYQTTAPPPPKRERSGQKSTWLICTLPGGAELRVCGMLAASHLRPGMSMSAIFCRLRDGKPDRFGRTWRKDRQESREEFEARVVKPDSRQHHDTEAIILSGPSRKQLINMANADEKREIFGEPIKYAPGRGKIVEEK